LLKNRRPEVLDVPRPFFILFRKNPGWKKERRII